MRYVVSDDGTLVACYLRAYESPDPLMGTLEVWNLATREKTADLPQPLIPCAFSPDNKWIAVLDPADWLLKRCDTASGELSSLANAEVGELFLHLSADGSRLVTVTSPHAEPKAWYLPPHGPLDFRRLVLRDVVSGSKIADFEVLEQVDGVILDDGTDVERMVISKPVRELGVLCCYDLKTGQLKWETSTPGPVVAISLSAHADRLAVACDKHEHGLHPAEISVWDTVHRVRSQIVSDLGQVDNLALLPDGSSIAFGTSKACCLVSLKDPDRFGFSTLIRF